MSNITLPLWDKDEKDVLPEFQLSYGHVLVPLSGAPINAVRMARKLGFRRCGSGSPFEYDRLPMHPMGSRHLGNAEIAQILIATSDTVQSIFAPHFLFLNNRRWMKWNKRGRKLMAIGNRYNLVETGFKLFRYGNRLCDVWAKGETLEILKDPVIEASFFGKIFYRSPPSPSIPHDEVIELLKNDIDMEQRENRVLFRKRFGGAEVETDSVLQFDVYDWRAP